MRAIVRVQQALLAALALIGTVAITALMLHVVADVVLRNVANTPIPATYEIVTKYYMIALAFVPLAWVERRGGMVQVEVINGLLGPSALVWSDRLVAVLSTVIYAALAWVTFVSAMKTAATGAFVMAQSTRLPTWPGFFLPPIGFTLAALVTLTRIFAPKQGPVT
jgi:TRAP-type C4-dicarboxylate transport system permease small subunit